MHHSTMDQKTIQIWHSILDWVHRFRFILAPIFMVGLVTGLVMILPIGGTFASAQKESHSAANAAATQPVTTKLAEEKKPAELMSTSIPDQVLVTPTPRTEIMKYTIQPGDSIFGIAEKFGLNQKPVFWGNLYILGDDVHNILPGVEINILPKDGVLHRWTSWEGLNGVSSFYGVDPMDIINWPGNSFDLATIGDFSHPNIPEGTEFFVPGGKREPVSWIPAGLTRENAAVASSLGPGSCGAIYWGDNWKWNVYLAGSQPEDFWIRFHTGDRTFGDRYCRY